ncbi:MAG: sensor histidine kinase [Rubritepida sp.]|nr:sensor histidine kinase [Rubritepida sp.]
MTASHSSLAESDRSLWALAMNATATAVPAVAQDLPLRLLRHHTKNTLQRILAEVVLVDDKRLSPEGGRILRDIERRIMLSAVVSDALFGMTDAPKPMEFRLRSLCKGTIELLSNPDQIIRLELTVEGECPAELRETVLRAMHEMVGNAIKHGLHERMLGRIKVRLTSTSARTRLCVEDDGWGFATQYDAGEGLGLTSALAEQHGGVSSLHRVGDGTRAEMLLPHEPARRGAG